MSEVAVKQDLQYKIADISLADWGRKEIDIAEQEIDNMPTNHNNSSQYLGSLGQFSCQQLDSND